ncbi:DNA-binding transcriptional LysR family regulator [Stella humosa]|uniref:DNA-binding transcriptional LysR family regulator n=1 Tax=Stella humosa TaxID=94 RepID=A0A3N1KSX0_9PROT|nr:LysR substrate-binding domain-containing protein [Stella humosa]ROP83094.1 DNA-binding transcriptional LysR family regulator [Stella humosa]BBK30129.1 transcriptional regulator [Stella humosa]
MSRLASLVPSARGLYVFEAAARTGSCSAAAREFNVTQPSVSRNVAQLEAALGVKLFIRGPSGLTLTAEGRSLHDALRSGFGQIETAIEGLLADGSRRPAVTLSLSSAFVTHWFVPRLGAFNAAFPTIDLRFELISGALRGPATNVDLATRMLADEDPLYHRWDFAPEIVVPVCSPAYLRAHGPLDHASDGAGHTLLNLTDRQLEWTALWGEIGQRRSRQASWLEFPDYAVVVQAAMNGEGIALGWLGVVASQIRNGALVPASARRIATGRTHHLIAPRARAIRQVVLDIRDWLTAGMADDIAAVMPCLPAPVAADRPPVPG